MGTRSGTGKPDDDFSYTNAFYNRPFRFTSAPGEVVARFKPSSDPRTALNDLRAMPLAAGKPASFELGVGVFRVPPQDDLPAAQKRLEAVPHVSRTLPALIDEDACTRYFVPDEVTVQFRRGIGHQEAEQIISREQCKIAVRERTRGYYTLTIPPGEGVFETLRRLSGLEQVEFAEPSEIVYDALSYTPTDSRFGEQNGMFAIHVEDAWDITRGSPDVIVAIIDTGVDLDHPDLAANILSRGQEDWDFALASNKVPEDTSGPGHGTHVAGIAAAVENGDGVVGVAPLSRIMPLRVLRGAVLRAAAAANAIDYVASQALSNPDLRYVINLSLWHGRQAAIHNAIRRAVSADVVVVAGVGNGRIVGPKRALGFDLDDRPIYPAVHPEVIGVAATAADDVKATFSNFGTAVDVSAPGHTILSTLPNNTHGRHDGTSMSAPHVTGVAALVWSANPALSGAQVRQIVESTCDNIDAQNPDFVGQLGRGRINAFKAVVAALFSVRVHPGALELPLGSQASATVLIGRAGGFSQPVALSITGLPDGISPSFSDDSPTGDSTTLTLDVAVDAPLGSHDAVISGTFSGITRSALLQVQIKVFTLSLSEPGVFLMGSDAEHKSADVTVTINRSPGFQDSVQLSLEDLPSDASPGEGVSASVAPTETTGNTGTLHVAAGRFAEEANFDLTIRGTAEDAVDTAELAVEVFSSAVASPLSPMQQ